MIAAILIALFLWHVVLPLAFAAVLWLAVYVVDSIATALWAARRAYYNTMRRAGRLYAAIR